MQDSNLRCFPRKWQACSVNARWQWGTRRKNRPTKLHRKSGSLFSSCRASVYAHARLVYKFQLFFVQYIRLHVLSIRRQHY